MLLNNQSIISNHSDIDIDFKDYLEMKDSIIFKKCKNVKLKINSKFNKLIFWNCNNVILKCCETISGIEIENCNSFQLIPLNPYLLNVVQCFKSSVELILFNQSILNKIIIVNEDSDIVTSYLP